jgi:Flp pilus assembly protein TadG
MARLALLLRLRSSRSGAAAAELAIAAPLLLLVFMGTWDFSRAFSARLDLVESAGRAAELATAYGSVRTDYSTLRTEALAAAAASGVAGTAATVDNWLECNGVRQPSATVVRPAAQPFARYVSVRVSGTYVPLFSVARLVAGEAVPINGAATVRIQ